MHRMCDVRCISGYTHTHNTLHFHDLLKKINVKVIALNDTWWFSLNIYICVCMTLCIVWLGKRVFGKKQNIFCVCKAFCVVRGQLHYIYILYWANTQNVAWRFIVCFLFKQTFGLFCFTLNICWCICRASLTCFRLDKRSLQIYCFFDEILNKRYHWIMDFVSIFK